MKRYIYINDDESSQYLYCDNRISNRKYTLLNFLPKNLWEQFSRFMNQYFLLIACLQLWSLITPVNPASTWGPLIFIFAVSATKEAWDDYNRYLSDKKANGKEVWVVRQGIKKHIKAQDIHVGNIVWLRENDEVPCDLVLIGTSEAQGLCYVETSALDGETDLKTRVIPPTCMGIDLELLHKIKGLIECPNPDKDIRRFDANLRLFPPFIDNDMCPLTIKNTLLQSCYLRNTEWACGVAVYTGNETKLGMSRGIPEPKLTAVDAMIDKLTGAIFVFQIVVVIVLGVAGNVWKDTEARKQWYVLYPEEGPWYELLVIPLRFELLCSIMIPISIKVSLDLVKSLYAKFIDWDNEMIDRETSTPAHATNTAISEDLGQVEYILTDKTGTLTENRMIFRRCCINGIFYGNENGNALKDEELINAVASGSSDVIRFLTVMAICNTVIPIQSKSGSILYKAQSQDEDALVHAAAQLHMVFVNKNSNILEIKFNASTIQYEALEILEFTSDRKRMSVVVKDCQNGRIILLSKGADEAILPYACAGQQTRTFVEAVDQYAQLGLRTLCLAWRELKEEEYQEWSWMFKEASSTLVDREWRIAEVCQRLEHDFEVLGVTAIEDRLQDGVPETIEALRKAGINFWMLTGDKQNTAIQIALSCNFISLLPTIAGKVIELSTYIYPDLKNRIPRILEELKREELKFVQTLERGEKYLDQMLVDSLLSAKESGTAPFLSGKDAFLLYDTYGFPVEITAEVAEERGVSIDMNGFDIEMENQRRQSQAAHSAVKLSMGNSADVTKDVGDTKFLGYETLSATAVVESLIVNGSPVLQVSEGSEVEVLLNRTPFYAESGGQIGDHGFLYIPQGENQYKAVMEIIDVQKSMGNIFVHKGTIKEGALEVGREVEAAVDARLRQRAKVHHTATHLLQSALKKVIGQETSQAGSLVAFERLRFDFNFHRPLTDSELAEIESLVNKWVGDATPLQTKVMPLADAKGAGAIAMFGEKYGEEVRVVEVPGVSMELCGGTHVSNTSEIRGFKIISEQGIASGIRRIEAVAGDAFIEYVNARDYYMKQLCSTLKVKAEEVTNRVDNLLEELRMTRNEASTLREKAAVYKASIMASKAISVGTSQKVSVLVESMEDTDADSLKKAAEYLIETLEDPAAVILGSCPGDEKVSLVAAFTPGVVNLGIQAGKFIGPIAKLCGGGGGGRPNFAQAGGRKPENLSSALEKARSEIISVLSEKAS